MSEPWLSSEVNTILISSLLAIIGAGVPLAVAWLRMMTKRISEQNAETKAMIQENIERTQTVQKQTDGLTVKMQAIASAVGFSKGREKGRKEGESPEPYEALTSLEDEISKIMKTDYTTKQKPRT